MIDKLFFRLEVREYEGNGVFSAKIEVADGYVIEINSFAKPDAAAAACLALAKFWATYCKAGDTA